MKKSVILATALGLFAIPSAFPQGKGNASEGKDAFLKHCAACHGADGNGKEAVAKLLKVTIPPLGSKDVQSLSDDGIRKVITEGKGKMKPVRDLSKADLANLTAFIRTLQK
jgi:mono/diheme cytochrome c family protein